MSNFQVEISPAARKSMKSIQRKDLQKIQVAIELLSVNPRPPASKQLVNSPYFRVRVGDYRILYEIVRAQLRILVIEIGHRKDVYK